MCSFSAHGTAPVLAVCGAKSLSKRRRASAATAGFEHVTSPITREAKTWGVWERMGEVGEMRGGER